MDLYSQGYERSYTVNSSILNAIEPHLKDFQQLLLDPPKVKGRQSGVALSKMAKMVHYVSITVDVYTFSTSSFFLPQKSAILTTVGVLEQPLGNARLHVARLVAALLQTSDPSICQGLCNLSTMDVLLVGPQSNTIPNREAKTSMQSM